MINLKVTPLKLNKKNNNKAMKIISLEKVKPIDILYVKERKQIKAKRSGSPFKTILNIPRHTNI